MDKKYEYDFVLECGPLASIRETFEFDEKPTDVELSDMINDWVLSNSSFYWEEK